MLNRESKLLTECSIAPLADPDAKPARFFLVFSVQQRPQEVLEPVVPFDFSSRWQSTATCFLSSRRVKLPSESGK
jgi:hypothetical protein